MEVETELADFVEEEGAVAGGADEAGVIAVSAGEGAAAVAEEIAFEKLAGDGGAVDGDEGFQGAVGVGVDGAGEDFLAGAAFAGNEYADGGAGDTLSKGHELAHAPGDDRAVAIDVGVVGGPERRAFLAFGACALKFIAR